MHEMLTVADVRGVCQSVCLSVTRLKSAAASAVYATCRVRGSFVAAFTKCLWPLVGYNNHLPHDCKALYGLMCAVKILPTHSS